MEIDNIEHLIALGEMDAAQVFTQMKQHIDAGLIRVVKQARTHKLEDFDSELNWLCRCVADAKET